MLHIKRLRDRGARRPPAARPPPDRRVQGPLRAAGRRLGGVLGPAADPARARARGAKAGRGQAVRADARGVRRPLLHGAEGAGPGRRAARRHRLQPGAKGRARRRAARAARARARRAAEAARSGAERPRLRAARPLVAPRGRQRPAAQPGASGGRRASLARYIILCYTISYYSIISILLCYVLLLVLL